MQSTTNGGKALDRAFPFLWWVIKRKKEKVCSPMQKIFKGYVDFCCDGYMELL
ncbi:TPA: hypothetical protein RQB26_001845 [Clostridioides difficile]|uniref:hypothetical protein n=1 Tax=Clostridioides difficile TaxID=1496 RepID=UPI000235AE67|nr:hypothetical protein [Clostridioides difficile]EHJ38862.1 hypothetical protein HMPREF9945_01535 [Clostridioides difficile 70-100-2010]EIS9690927.1 hypothetical protein [Clostridioides difficile]EJA6339057.1 hypothetical protein [Clostridioides difficile]EKG0808180.1 hypothetical protein [Clostridioides difficile]EKJ1265018.1 hypothetical protein [Clostridioides difficile]